MRTLRRTLVLVLAGIAGVVALAGPAVAGVISHG